MTQWETRFEMITGVANNVQERALELGKQGWQLVQVGPFIAKTDLSDTHTLVWFKRIRKFTPEELSKGYVPA